MPGSEPRERRKKQEKKKTKRETEGRGRTSQVLKTAVFVGVPARAETRRGRPRASSACGRAAEGEPGGQTPQTLSSV
jgi:hypothetical protein